MNDVKMVFTQDGAPVLRIQVGKWILSILPVKQPQDCKEDRFRYVGDVAIVDSTKQQGEEGRFVAFQGGQSEYVYLDGVQIAQLMGKLLAANQISNHEASREMLEKLLES